MEQAVTRDTSREQMAARFIKFPPEPPCILTSFHVLEPRLVRRNPDAEDHIVLHEDLDTLAPRKGRDFRPSNALAAPTTCRCIPALSAYPVTRAACAFSKPR